MNNGIRIIELTKDNEKDFLDQVANLENKVMDNMEKRGQVGQLFPTGKEDISVYAHSDENTVLMAVNGKNNVIAASYITQGQKPYTYNDITKYFKYGDKYNKYVRSTYASENEYKRDLINTYKIKIDAYKYAKTKIGEDFPEYNGDMMAFLNHELNEKNNGYHEKSKLRESLNAYMSDYIEKCEKEFPGIKENYEKFYWITAKDVMQIFAKDNVAPKDKDQLEYQTLLEKGKLEIYEEPNFDITKYYDAKTSNAIELDTYITDPEDRTEGLARMLVLEGIEKHMNRHFANKDNSEIFLCSTLHRNNLSSKYVSEFFGLTDSLYVKRRDGRNREVHICRVDRGDYKNYLDFQRKRIAVLYGDNPKNIKVSKEEELEILKEQIYYEQNEATRLKTASREQAFNGGIDFEKRKQDKVKVLEDRMNKVYYEIANEKRR